MIPFGISVSVVLSPNLLENAKTVTERFVRRFMVLRRGESEHEGD